MKRVCGLLAIGGVMVIAATPLPAAERQVELTIYRNSGDALFEGGGSPVSDGHAIVHEQRDVRLSGGRQQIVIDGLPTTLDPEAVALRVAGASVLAQRVVAIGDGGTLAARRGERVELVVAGGTTLHGLLVGYDGSGVTLRGDDGAVSYVRDFSIVRFTAQSGEPGSTLQAVVDGGSGTAPARLTYPIAGIGWRAAYSATLSPGNACSLRLEALASIANRSGRDYVAAMLTLVAGEPNLESSSRPRVAYAAKGAMASMGADGLPQQASFGDYRSYRVAEALDLPDASVTQTPLYAPRDVDCARTWLFDPGQRWMADKPMTAAGGAGREGSAVASLIRFKAPDNLPAGFLRVLAGGQSGRLEYVGGGQVADTGKGLDVQLSLGSAFDLTGTRERTGFSVDRAARSMNEAFRIVLTNTGESARQVTIREYPNRWRNWRLASASIAPIRQGADGIEFDVGVPPGGTARLDYAIDYSWTSDDE